MEDHDMIEARKAGALALDILQSGLHYPLEDGKVNVEQIHDHIIIGMYSGELCRISQNVIDLAIDTVQDMVDIYKEK